MADDNTEIRSTGPCSPKSPQSSTGCKETGSSSPKRAWRIKLTEQQLENLSKEEIMIKWREQDSYIEYVENQTNALESDLTALKESEVKYRQQYAEASHREKILVRRLASKESELQEYITQINEMKAAQAPTTASLRSTLIDPAVNLLIQKLRQELLTTKAKLEDTQNELSAWKFTPDSNTGKRLMAKCRLLYQENEELGRMISSGRIAKLEGELALQKSFSEEVKKSQSELDEFLQDLDEDVEGMQSTIYFLQQELRKARESVTLLQQENATLKSSSSMENNLTNGLSPHTPPIVVKKEELEEKACNSDEIKLDQQNANTGCENSPCTLVAETLLPASDSASVEKNPDKQELNDDSSSDSAALIIKVENEFLSEEREEEEDTKITKRTLKTRAGSKSNGKINRDEVITRTTRGRDKTKRDKGNVTGSDEERIVFKKKRKDLYTNVDRNKDEEKIFSSNSDALQSDLE